MQCRNPQDLNRTAVELENKLRKALLDLGNFRRKVIVQSETCSECGQWFHPSTHPNHVCRDNGINPKRSNSFQLYNIEESESNAETVAPKKSYSLNDASVRSEPTQMSSSCTSCGESRSSWVSQSAENSNVSEEECSCSKPTKKSEKKWAYSEDESQNSSLCESKPELECNCSPKKPEKHSRRHSNSYDKSPKCSCSPAKEPIIAKEKVGRKLQQEVKKPEKRRESHEQRRLPKAYPCASSSDAYKKEDIYGGAKSEWNRAKGTLPCTCSQKSLKPCQCHLYKTPRETLLKRIKVYKQRDKSRQEEITNLQGIHKDLIDQLVQMKKFAQELSNTTQENGDLISKLNRLLEEKQTTIQKQNQDILEKESQIVKLLRNEMNIKHKCNQICNHVARQNECPGLKKECQQLLKALHDEMDKVMRKDEVIQKQAKEICMLQCSLDKRAAEVSGLHQELGSSRYNPKKVFIDDSTQCECGETIISTEKCSCDDSITSSNSNSVILKMTIR